MAEVWAVGDAYESYVGRWSRRVAAEFLGWLSVSVDSRWLDAGCGTGALTSTILAAAGPRAVVGLDPSGGFVSTARREVADARAAFVQADACAVPCVSDRFDAVVGALMLNFVPDSARAVDEFARVASPGGTVAAYVWDYADGMQLMRYFWDAATELDPSTADRDEGRRFPICRPGALSDAWTRAGL
ncbi:MAG TPA: class I SAM-dependent methyltransferase, partial [Micromonosporaceae bacterium]